MILEHGLLRVRAGQEEAFEQAFREASPIIAASEGYMGHSLSRCLEAPSTFLLLVRWRSVEDHEKGFRGSPAYQDWKKRLHHFYDPFPTIQHFTSVIGSF